MIRLTVESSATNGPQPMLASDDSPIGQLFTGLPHLNCAILYFGSHEAMYRRVVDNV